MRLLYRLLLILLSPVLLLLLLRDSHKRQGGWRFIKQRLGWGYPHFTPQAIWIHCASVGELKAAEPLIAHLNCPLLVTTNTPTAGKLLTQLDHPQLQWAYLPFDWSSAVQRFLNQAHPQQLWIIETEIWPNLYAHCAQRGIPMTLLNARLTEKTLNTPKWLKILYQQTLQYVRKILARDEKEAQRFQQLGVPKDKIQVLGNLKMAAQLLPEKIQNPQSCLPISRPYVLFASTHDPEEVTLTQQWLNLNRPELLVIVPRHPQRGDALRKALSALTPHIAQYSQNESVTETTQIWLVDTIGQLSTLYPQAKAVIMGGSFGNKGGHNLLEPAQYATPIITGPDMRDFQSETMLLLNAEAVRQVPDIPHAIQQLNTLLTDPEQAQTLGRNAQTALATQKSILQHYLNALEVPDTCRR